MKSGQPYQMVFICCVGLQRAGLQFGAATELHLYGKMVIEVTQIEVHLERLSKTRYSFQCHPQIVPLLQLMESDRVTKCSLQ